MVRRLSDPQLVNLRRISMAGGRSLKEAVRRAGGTRSDLSAAYRFGRPRRSAKTYSLRGRSHVKQDRKLYAKSPGWRRTSGGRYYFENRANRAGG